MVLLVFSGFIFSFDGGEGGNGFVGLAGSLPFSDDFTARLPAETEAVDRTEVDDGVFLNAVAFSGVVRVTGLVVPFAVCVDAFRARDVATEAVLASEGRLPLADEAEARAGAGAFGDRDVTLRAELEVVEEVDILRVRARESRLDTDSRAVLNAEEAVDVSLLLDIDKVDGGRDDGDGGGRRVVFSAAFLRIVDACERTEVTDAADDFGRCTFVTVTGARAPTPGRLEDADVPACAANAADDELPFVMLSARLSVCAPRVGCN